jgi:hypothetical protein
VRISIHDNLLGGENAARCGGNFLPDEFVILWLQLHARIRFTRIGEETRIKLQIRANEGECV